MYEMRIYLLNNTKPYRDGDEEYAGEWFNCPVEFEEVREKLGVEHESTPTAAWFLKWRVRLLAMK